MLQEDEEEEKGQPRGKRKEGGNSGTAAGGKLLYSRVKNPLQQTWADRDEGIEISIRCSGGEVSDSV